MSDHHREENDRLLRLVLRRYVQEESDSLPSADELRAIRFSSDYAERREEILRCGGRPEQTEGGLWYAGDSITSRNDAVLREAFAAYCEEDNRVPSGEALANVTFSKAYQKRKRQILRAKGRPVDIRVVHSRKTRRILRVGIVAALIAVIAMTSVFSNLNSKQDYAGFEINMDNYFGIIESPTTPGGFAVEDPSRVYIEQPDGTHVLPQQYAPSYIPADYPVESYSCDGEERYIFRKDNAFLFWPGDYITFTQNYMGATHIFNLEDFTLEEIEVEGLGKCLYHAENKGNHKSLVWRNGPYVFQVSVSNLSKDELIKIAKSTKLKQN